MKKKYLFMISSMQIGGAEVGLVDVINELSKENIVDLVLLRKEGALLQKLNKKVKVYEILNQKRSKLLNKIVRIMYFMGGIFSKIIYKITIKEKYDVECAYLEGYPTVFIASSPNKKSVKIASVRVGLKKHHLTIDKYAFSRKLLLKAYQKMDYIYTVSDLTTEEFKEKYPSLKDKIKTIYTYFDIESIRNKANMPFEPIYNKENFNLLAVGRFDDQKGYDRLVLAMSQVSKKHPSVKLHIIGKSDTEYGLKIQKMIKEQKLDDIIILHGIKENPYPYIKNADVLVSSSLYEGFPRVINEALALGKLCIGTNVTGTKEALQYGKLGILVNDSVDGIIDGIEQVINNNHKYSLFSKEISKYDGNKATFFKQFHELTEKKPRMIIFFPKIIIGGMENALKNLIKLGKLNEKYDLTLFLAYKGDHNCYLDFPSNIKIKVMCKGTWNIIGKINSIFKICFYILYYFFSPFDISISYAHQHWILGMLTRISSNNSICFIHSNIEKSRNKKELHNLLKQMQFNKFSKLICVSQNGKEALSKYIKNKKIYYVNNMIDGAEIIAKSKEEVKDYLFTKNTKVFINVSRHEEVTKKLTRIILAMQKLNNEGYKYHVIFVGDGEDHGLYKKLKKQFSLNNLSIIGMRENPYKYYANSDAVLVSSISEGYPVVFNEAMILHKPIITTDVSDAKQDIQNKFGIVVPNDENGIYYGMKQYLDHGFSTDQEFNYQDYNNKIINQLIKIFEE